MVFSFAIFALALNAADAARAPLDQKATCSAVTREDSMDACTAIIQAGQLSGTDLAKVYLNHGLGNVRRGHTDLALQDFSRAIALDPNFNPGYVDRGTAYLSQSDYAHAIQDFDHADGAKPNDALILVNRCRARAQWGQELDKARADCDHALELNSAPLALTIYLTRALVRYRQGDNDGTIADATAALGIARGDAWALYIRGLAHIRGGDITIGNAEIAQAKTASAGIADLFAKFGVTP
jgi:tetratricopeptide (TPR) repeat protein